jgi:hypothetical protein
MTSKHLETYLNDHLAGSETALEMLAYLISAYPNSDVEAIARDVRADVMADRKELESLMSRLGIAQSSIRKASAWLSEKLAQLKLRMDDASGGEFRLLEATEAIVLGITGKELLWRALAAASEPDSELDSLDYNCLIARASEQRALIEALRLRAARAAFSPAASAAAP